MTLKIAILGGGIIGISCAVKIAEFYKNLAKVTVISDDFTPNTTGDGSAGLWGPFLVNKSDTENVLYVDLLKFFFFFKSFSNLLYFFDGVQNRKWSKETHDFLHQLWLSNDANEAGICLLPCIRVTTSSNGLDTFWKNIVYGCHNINSEYLKKLSKQCDRNFT